MDVLTKLLSLDAIRNFSANLNFVYGVIGIPVFCREYVSVERILHPRSDMTG